MTVVSTKTRTLSDKSVRKNALPERFVVLAKQKAWTDEQLRQSYDLPKTPLPPGTAIVRLPTVLMDDPFKANPPANAEYEFQGAESVFYARLKCTTLTRPGENVSKSSTPSRYGNRSRMSSQNRKATGFKQSPKK